MRIFNSIKVMLGLGLGFTIVIHAQIKDDLWHIFEVSLSGTTSSLPSPQGGPTTVLGGLYY